MQTIEAFFYKNILEIQVIDPAIFSTRNRIVYSRTIKIYQGIDNPIHIVTKNQDQKAVDLTGYDVQVDIQDPENALTVETFTVNFITQTKGLGVFTIPKAVVNALDQRHYEFTVKLIDLTSNDETPMYIDDNYGARLPVQVLSGYYSNTPVLPVAIFDGVVDAGELE
jgi:hypothetical protein